jgi:hypothetical protein
MQDMTWHLFEPNYGKVPSKIGRYLVARSQGYVQIALWNGDYFIPDELPTHRPLSDVDSWCDIPQPPNRSDT